MFWTWDFHVSIALFTAKWQKAGDPVWASQQLEALRGPHSRGNAWLQCNNQHIHQRSSCGQHIHGYVPSWYHSTRFSGFVFFKCFEVQRWYVCILQPEVIYIWAYNDNWTVNHTLFNMRNCQIKFIMLAGWPKSNAPDCIARFPLFDSWLWHYLSWNVLIPFTMIFYLKYT